MIYESIHLWRGQLQGSVGLAPQRVEILSAVRVRQEMIDVVGAHDLGKRVMPPVTYHRPMPQCGRGVGDDLGLAD